MTEMATGPVPAFPASSAATTILMPTAASPGWSTDGLFGGENIHMENDPFRQDTDGLDGFGDYTDGGFED